MHGFSKVYKALSLEDRLIRRRTADLIYIMLFLYLVVYAITAIFFLDTIPAYARSQPEQNEVEGLRIASDIYVPFQ